MKNIIYGGTNVIKRYPTHCGDETCASCVKAGDFIFLSHHGGGFDRLDVEYQIIRPLNLCRKHLPRLVLA